MATPATRMEVAGILLLMAAEVIHRRMAEAARIPPVEAVAIRRRTVGEVIRRAVEAGIHHLMAVDRRM